MWGINHIIRQNQLGKSHKESAPPSSLALQSMDLESWVYPLVLGNHHVEIAKCNDWDWNCGYLEVYGTGFTWPYHLWTWGDICSICRNQGSSATLLGRVPSQPMWSLHITPFCLETWFEEKEKRGKELQGHRPCPCALLNINDSWRTSWMVSKTTITHRIHVCHIWYHLPSIYPKC